MGFLGLVCKVGHDENLLTYWVQSDLNPTRSIFRLPVTLMLGIVWTVVLVLISIELMQPEEPHPDSIEYQSRVDQGSNLYRRGTLEDIQLKEPAVQPGEGIIASRIQRKD